MQLSTSVYSTSTWVTLQKRVEFLLVDGFVSQARSSLSNIPTCFWSVIQMLSAASLMYVASQDEDSRRTGLSLIESQHMSLQCCTNYEPYAAA